MWSAFWENYIEFKNFEIRTSNLLDFHLASDFLSNVLLHTDSAFSRNPNMVTRLTDILCEIHPSGTYFILKEHIFTIKPNIKHSTIVKGSFGKSLA